jgi:hypothetical protein
MKELSRVLGAARSFFKRVLEIFKNIEDKCPSNFEKF